MTTSAYDDLQDKIQNLILNINSKVVQEAESDNDGAVHGHNRLYATAAKIPIFF